MNENVCIKNGNVYNGTRQLTIKNQRGKQYVNNNGKQINLKSIKKIESEEDKQFDEIFNYGWIKTTV